MLLLSVAAGRSGGAKAAAQNLSEALSRKIRIPEARSVLNVSENFTKEELETVSSRSFSPQAFAAEPNEKSHFRTLRSYSPQTT